MNAQTKKTLRAGQLAKLAGVSAPTIKHYVNEGLIPKPLKTGKTMAYYDEACVERIKLIKKLQREKFLPLEVIKRVLDSGSAYEEELELGQAILKSHRLPADARPVGESRIERRTGFPLDKIHLLEREGLVSPASGDGGRRYDSIDCRIIEIMKRREELGLPLDHSIETIRLYRDAIMEAVRGDMRLFAKNLLGDASIKQTIKFLTEVDDTLDSFMLLIRQKMLRSFSQSALTQMSEMPARLGMLSFLPVAGTELRNEPPEKPGLRIAHFFLSGAYDSAIQYIESQPAGLDYPSSAAALVMANLLRGDSGAALAMAERRIPKPTSRIVDNTAAGLAYMFSSGDASGFSGPMYLAKKALGYLKRVETSRKDGGLSALFARYVCGAVYTMLPDIFDTSETGLRMLAHVEKSLRIGRIKTGRLPSWLAGTLEHEVFPALEIRANRFLCEGHLRLGSPSAARKCIERIIDLADIDDQHSTWARFRKLEIGK